MASATCSNPECRKEIGTFERHYTCSGCGNGFCDDCCCNDSYIRHLANWGGDVAKAVSQGGYLCVLCLRKFSHWDQDWEKNFIDRICAHNPCDNRLDSLWTLKGACCCCGRLFCGNHRKSKTYVAAQARRGVEQYPQAPDICVACTPSDQREEKFAQRQFASVLREGEEATARILESARRGATEIVEAADLAIQRRLSQAREELERASVGASEQARGIISEATERVRREAQGIVAAAEDATQRRITHARQEAEGAMDRRLEHARTIIAEAIDNLDAKTHATLSTVRAHIADMEDRVRELGGQAEDKARRGYVLLGLRVALAAASVLVATAALPRLQFAAQEPTKELWDLVWSSLMLVASGTFLTLEFIRPAFSDKKARPHAVALVAAAAVITAYLLAAPGR